MNLPIRWIALTTLALTLVFADRANAEGWGWNPFSTKKTSSTSTNPSYSTYKQPNASKSWLPSWKAPTFSWQKKKTSTYSQNNSTSWQKLSKSSKRWWTKTSEALSPYPSENSSTTASSNSSTGTKSSFAGWFGKSSKKEEFASAPEFLRQPMP